ncbi:uncharacterized protein G2W53_012881 [Senna tora]|uniref:Uncharacterized protein n=1 Tax=Senna tora TaxID=362788 RepID=A0A834TXI1_9FABA|nr:uncharacterized protein G2W53_012881 [Senna tora]
MSRMRERNRFRRSDSPQNGNPVGMHVARRVGGLGLDPVWFIESRGWGEEMRVSARWNPQQRVPKSQYGLPMLKLVSS